MTSTCTYKLVSAHKYCIGHLKDVLSPILQKILKSKQIKTSTNIKQTN